MAELVAVNPDIHGKLQVVEGAVVKQAANQHIVGIRAIEISKVAGDLPVFITRNTQTGDWALSAICSFTPNENLVVENETWLPTYLPTSMQTYPFYLMQAPEEEKGYLVGIDASNPVFVEEGGEALFDESGKVTQYVNSVTAQLDADIRNDIQTHQFLQRLEAAGLIKSIDLQVHYANGSVNTIQGLSTIDEDALQGVDDKVLREFHSNGYLMTMHALLISGFQLNRLIRRQNEQDSTKQIAQVKLENSKDQVVS